MNPLQVNFLILSAVLSGVLSLKGIWESSKKENAFGDTIFLGWLGIFVWGDAVVFGPFWFLASLVPLLLRDWSLFLVIVSLFWVVRSLGETQYWFNQQFSNVHRNPPEKMRCYGLFKNDSIWFGYQIFWQCILVASLIFSIYSVSQWLQN